MEQIDRIAKLIAAYLRQEITADEQNELEAWINESDANRLYFTRATDEKLLTEKIRQFMRYDPEHSLSKSLDAAGGECKDEINPLFARVKKYAVAACFLLIAGAVAYYILNSNKSTSKVFNVNTDINNYDLPPGSEKAFLSLADGTNISLDSSTAGIIAQQGNSVVVKENGVLIYKPNKTKVQTEIFYNTLATPMGGESGSVVLPDGTKVWLNSASSISFPSTFMGNERMVEITGEAYFEVAKKAGIPFIVKVNDIEVEVMGTHFNINSYDNEASIKITVLEGTVNVSAYGKSSIVKAGQQANLDESKVLKVLDFSNLPGNSNLEEAVSWKNGVFKFMNVDMKTIMRQISRWYAVDVVFEDNVPGRWVITSMSRKVPLSKILGLFPPLDPGIHFEVGPKRILVKYKRIPKVQTGTNNN